MSRRVKSLETGVEFKSIAEAVRRTGFSRYMILKSDSLKCYKRNREGIMDRFEVIDQPQRRVTHETIFINVGDFRAIKLLSNKERADIEDLDTYLNVYEFANTMIDLGYTYDQDAQGFYVELTDGRLPVMVRAALQTYNLEYIPPAA